MSVIIPSRSAGHELFRALASVRAQTYPNLETVVVLDNATLPAETVSKLEAFADKVIQVTEPLGGSAARNLGIQNATGHWIALLDDDDEWAPQKIERQIAESQRLLACKNAVISTRVTVQQGSEQRTWPLKPAPSGDPMRISEYLFCISSPSRRGEGFVQTSTLLAPRSLFLAVPFTPGLPIHQDWDWLLRASTQSDFFLSLLWEPLTVYHLNVGGTSVSQTKRWQPSFDWAKGNPLISPRAYAYFLATVVARYLPLRSLPLVLREFFKRSDPDKLSIFLFVLFFGFPEHLRLSIAQRLRGKSSLAA